MGGDLSLLGWLQICQIKHSNEFWLLGYVVQLQTRIGSSGIENFGMDEKESSKNKSLQVDTIFFLGGSSYDQSGSKIKYKEKICKIKKY